MRVKARAAGRSRQQSGLTDTQLVLAWQSASLLLGYPDEELLARAGLLRDVAARWPRDAPGRPSSDRRSWRATSLPHRATAPHEPGAPRRDSPATARRSATQEPAACR